MNKKPFNPFLKSALTEENPYISTKEVEQWLQIRNNEVEVKVKKIKFSELGAWNFDNEQNMLRHKTGRFFTIEGIEVKTNWGVKSTWTQPIINQPEIGYLGIITKEINGILYFLLQAKIEPGNINYVQLSPTLQATKSNYSQIHGGKAPLYLEYFKDRENVSILLDQLQSEQGARFLQKRKRNIIIQ
ncbi:MAG: NDP-hexose 2,3-dehydratase family protein, partial [Bacteroidales bacterium]|nr:NDP-hexose 2,3-dehydratase family protein [Bacteroidales bacterium]